MSKLRRRHFMTQGSQVFAAGMFSQTFLAQSLVQALLSKASATEVGRSRRHVSIFSAGAPSRWMFDLFLAPYDTSSFDPTLNPMLANSFVEGARYTKTAYRFFKDPRSRVNLPWLWQFPVAAPGGGSRLPTDLLNNLLVIQGMNTGNGGHAASQRFHYHYRNSSMSLSAVAAAKSPQIFKGVVVGPPTFAFSSPQTPLFHFGGLDKTDNLIRSLTTPFSQALSESRSPGHLRQAVQTALTSLNKLALDRYPEAENILASETQARALFEKMFSGDLESLWLQKYKKYEDLIFRTIDSTKSLGQLPLFNDQPIGHSTQRGVDYSYAGPNVLAKHDDLRNLIRPRSTFPKYMAGHFALAEFLIERDLSNYISLAPAEFAHITDALGRSQGLTSHTFDEHVMGQFSALVINTSYHRAQLACLMEFIDFLKRSNQFKDTVIDLGGEFNRSPRTDGSGSDHGWTAKSVAIYSGAFKGGPYIVGNLKKNSSALGYPGPWGGGAPVKKTDGQIMPELTIAHYHATTAHLLKADNPTPEADSLVRLRTDGTLELLVEPTRLV